MAEDEERISQEKDIQFYSQHVAAWFTTRMEHDKSLLTLSAGGIGLLITLFSTVGVKSFEGLILYTCSIISFIICLFSILYIFNRNSSHIEDVLIENKPTDPILKVLDKIAFFSFFMGVITASILGFSIATKTFIKEEVKMSNEDKQIREEVKQNSFNESVNLKSTYGHIKGSFDGSAILRSTPQNLGDAGSRSFDGSAQLNPTTPTTSKPVQTDNVKK